MQQVGSPTIISNHPLDKIFGDIPARLSGFPHASVTRRPFISS